MPGPKRKSYGSAEPEPARSASNPEGQKGSQDAQGSAAHTHSRRSEFAHLQKEGEDWSSRMVDVGQKNVTVREATARARIDFEPGVLEEVLAGRGPKGPVEEVARTAGILAAKRTDEWIPMCHSLGLDGVDIEFERLGPDRLEVRCRCRCQGRTGVEMEALCGVSAAALTVYDMTKSASRGSRIVDLELMEKSGGRSGHWQR